MTDTIPPAAESLPQAGGSYIRDDETGDLRPAEAAPTEPQPAPAVKPGKKPKE